MTIDYDRTRAKADAQIRRWGARCYLRRAGVDRECWALEVQLSASEKRALKNLNNRVFIISPVGLDVPPDSKIDSLVIADGVTGAKHPPLRQAAPVAPLQPQPGGVVVYYEMQIEGNT